ncbi:hypothetical protein BGZ61DRAFT_461400 [Ilyonectria robusta]|uniref:uncharacterized protein n=1 Tax=Ilyonectria robusta TaxID=1079257 RepID=UPI001E8ECF78|nr:uncharacterized protein BGZ61DRAFT_461400 [Ilyonectria robusta]KAH8667221.1 hypothetical protein BGZ61DRAFT_461400 [Ilyonectria robusta]
MPFCIKHISLLPSHTSQVIMSLRSEMLWQMGAIGNSDVQLAAFYTLHSSLGDTVNRWCNAVNAINKGRRCADGSSHVSRRSIGLPFRATNAASSPELPPALKAGLNRLSINKVPLCIISLHKLLPAEDMCCNHDQQKMEIEGIEPPTFCRLSCR